MEMSAKTSSFPTWKLNQDSGLRKKFSDDAKYNWYSTSHNDNMCMMMSLDATLNAPSHCPDIEWYPSFERYQERLQSLARMNLNRPTDVPRGFPTTVREAWVWKGSDFDEHDYVVYLQESDITEIENALVSFKDRIGRLDLEDVTRDTFPLPQLKTKLESIAETLHFGIGFTVLRGLEPRKYSRFDNAIIYLGITSYIAEIRGCQDSSGNMFIHIKDLGHTVHDSAMRQSPYASNAQPFHNDVCDILAMYVQDQAVEGGESHLASCAQVYNEIASTRPDVIHTLAQPNWIFDKHESPPRWNTRALLFNFEGKGPSFCFSRRPITGSPTSPRSHGVPAMTEIQAEALDMVHFTALKNCLTMKLKRGDIQLINNLAIQHARSEFRDSSLQRRHIIRLWLRNETLAWKTPEGLQKTWFEKYGKSERRKNAKWNFLPGATRERILFRKDSCS